eukprot:GGOE01044621.1.p1 GENE.GGOE01044621.1~~GGOE01044621.1.p1  ORF type:complete len:466 (-),score=138.59 GGOE01044621.1:20-1378(-)
MGGQHGLDADAKKNAELMLNNALFCSQDDSVLCSFHSEAPSSSDDSPTNCSLAELQCVVDQVAQFDCRLETSRICFDIDSQHIIVAGPSGFGVLDWKTGQLLSKVVLYLNSLPGCIAMCPQSQGAVCGLKDGTLAYCKYCIAESVKASHRVLTGHQQAVVGVCMTPDGRMAVSAAESVRIWRLEEHTPEQEDAAMQAFGIAAVHGYDQPPASNSNSRCIQLRGHCCGTLTSASAAFTCVSIAPLGFSIAAGCQDGAVHLWSTLCCQTARIFAMALARKAKKQPEYQVDCQALRIILQDFLRNTKLHQFRLQQVLRGHTAAVCALAFSPNGNQVLSSGQDHQLCIWTSGLKDAAVVPVDGPVHSICIASTGHLALCATSSMLYICDPVSGVLVYSFSVAPCLAVALSADSRYTAVVGKRVLGAQVTVYQILPMRSSSTAMVATRLRDCLEAQH